MAKEDVMLVYFDDAKGKFLPMGALFVAGALEKAGYKPHLVPTTMKSDDFREKLSMVNPLYVGFSSYTFPNLSEMIRLSTVSKDEGYSTVWGGHHATVLAEQCIQEPFIDYVVKGEGEEAIIDFSKKFISGLEKKTILESKGKLKNIDSFSPALHLVDLNDYVSSLQPHLEQKYGALKNLGYLLTSRGCTSKCNFCGVHGMYSEGERSLWNANSPEYVSELVDEMQRQVKDLQSIIIWDDGFFAGKTFDNRATTILNDLKKRNLRFNLEARADFLSNEDNVKQLKELGCLQVFVGAESGSQRVLNLMNKRTTVGDYRKAASNCLGNDLPIRMSFFYGYPCETAQDISESKSFIEEMRSIGVSISGAKMYRPVPATKGYVESLRNGFMMPKDTLSWSKINSNTSPELLPWMVKIAKEQGVPSDKIYEWLNIRMND